MSKSDQVHDEKAAGGARWTRKQEMLLAFLNEPDTDPTHPPVSAEDPIELVSSHTCPVCSYNLKALTRPFCPECGKELKLTVGAANLHLGWLFAAVAPGFFSGIAAIFVLIPIFGRLFFGDGVLMPIPIMMDAFGWSSGIFAILLAKKRVRFLTQPLARQRTIALTLWFIHIAALGLFILIAAVFF